MRERIDLFVFSLVRTLSWGPKIYQSRKKKISYGEKKKERKYKYERSWQMILSRTYWTHFAVTEGSGVARIFQRGVTDRDTIRGSPTIYGLYRCSPSCISGLSGIIAAWRPILTKDKSHWRKYFTKKQIKVGFSTMAFTAKILSWRFRHLNIVGCLLKRRPTEGGGGS